jgi:transcriptional regulator with XRE-family HTH domain
MTNLENEVQTQLCSFGSRLRELRLRRAWTLQDLARESGLSKTFLSRLESGGRQASIAAVLTLSRVFGVSLAFFFESPLALEPCVIVRGADADERTTNGLKYKPLSNAGRFSRLQPLLIRVSPARRGKEHYRHRGEEWLYVLSGRLILSLAGATYELAPGDAAHFESSLPHRLIAPGPEDAEVLVVASPDSNPDYQSSFLERRAIRDIALNPPRSQKRLMAPHTPEKSQTRSPKKSGRKTL